MIAFSQHVGTFCQYCGFGSGIIQYPDPSQIWKTSLSSSRLYLNFKKDRWNRSCKLQHKREKYALKKNPQQPILKIISFLILQDLLQAVTLNCTTHSAIDIEIISSLSKLRLKTKQNINLFLTCLRLENILVCQCKDDLFTQHLFALYTNFLCKYVNTYYRDLCTAHPDNLPTMLKQTIFNELSNARQEETLFRGRLCRMMASL
jgi:hypothetical protein